MKFQAAKIGMPPAFRAGLTNCSEDEIKRTISGGNQDLFGRHLDLNVDVVVVVCQGFAKPFTDQDAYALSQYSQDAAGQDGQ